MPSGDGPGDAAHAQLDEDGRIKGEITGVLRELVAGKDSARERLLALVYDRLKRIAGGYLQRERAGHTLEPSDLVHEAYLRLFGDKPPALEDRTHLYRAFARAARRVLVDHARARAAAKRGGDLHRVTMTGSRDFPAAAGAAIDVLALDEALEGLSRRSERHARIVELRCFAGLTIPEVAETLGIGKTTVDKEWALAKAWLHAELAS